MVTRERGAVTVTTEKTINPFQLFLAIAIGLSAALLVLPSWLPGLVSSLVGATPTAVWYLVRSSGFVAFGLLWLSMAMGLMLTNKVARAWPGGPTAFDLHQFLSVLGLTFGFIHPLIMLGDQYSLVQIFVPFGGLGYRTIPVLFGQATLFLMAIVVPSFAMRSVIGQRTWRKLHYLTFPIFVMALAHGVLSGTDSATPFGAGMYWAAASSLIVLAVYRIMVAKATTRKPALAPVVARTSDVVARRR